MKRKIIIFLVGLFLGAIISTGSMYIYSIVNSNNNNQNMPDMNQTSEQGKISQDGQTPPSMPNNNQTN